jgi:hypothetical protein
MQQANNSKQPLSLTEEEIKHLPWEKGESYYLIAVFETIEHLQQDSHGYHGKMISGGKKVYYWMSIIKTKEIEQEVPNAIRRMRCIESAPDHYLHGRVQLISNPYPELIEPYF